MTPKYVFVSVKGRGPMLEHRAIAERAVGHRLPRSVQVHHVNCDGLDNRPENLVICQDATYHALLHLRTEALDACGNPDYRRCHFCKKYDAQANLVARRSFYHQSCINAWNRDRRARQSEAYKPLHRYKYEFDWLQRLKQQHYRAIKKKTPYSVIRTDYIRRAEQGLQMNLIEKIRKAA